MARVGKIARLPLDTREGLKRRLANGELGGSLLRWLNELPAVLERKRAEGARESKLVQVKNLHRRDAETRRECGMRDRAQERVKVSGGTRRGDSNLGGLAFLRDKSGIFGGSRRESNQVQAIAFFFAGAGIGARTTTGTGGYAGSAGLAPNRYMLGRRAPPLRSPHASAAPSDQGGFAACALSGHTGSENLLEAARPFPHRACVTS
jgi:hypothetical protein